MQGRRYQGICEVLVDVFFGGTSYGFLSKQHDDYVEILI